MRVRSRGELVLPAAKERAGERDGGWDEKDEKRADSETEKGQWGGQCLLALGE